MGALAIACLNIGANISFGKIIGSIASATVLVTARFNPFFGLVAGVIVRLVFGISPWSRRRKPTSSASRA